MEIVNDIINSLKDIGLYALFIASFVKIATSLVVALLAKEWNWSEFGEMFRKDLLRLGVVTGLILLYPNDAANAVVVTTYMTYLATRITANIGSIFPELGEMLPQSFAGRAPADSLPLTPQEKI